MPGRRMGRSNKLTNKRVGEGVVVPKRKHRPCSRNIDATIVTTIRGGTHQGAPTWGTSADVFDLSSSHTSNRLARNPVLV